MIATGELDISLILHCTVLYCTVLCCTVLYCAVLFCAVLCCAAGELDISLTLSWVMWVFSGFSWLGNLAGEVHCTAPAILQSYLYIAIHTYIYIYMHIYMYIYMHIYMHR